MHPLPAVIIAFEGNRCLGLGDPHLVATKAKQALDKNSDAQLVIFDAATSRTAEIDLRGSLADVQKRVARRIPAQDDEAAAEAAPRGPGRPKLGVVAREVTLLPRHWEWLNAQAGGASVALRKLVEEARRATGDKDRERQARDAAYHFMSTMAGNLPHFEEASRALFADDRRRFTGLIADWPTDIRDHIVKLAYSDRA